VAASGHQRPTTNDSIKEVSVQEEVHHARSLGLGVALGGALGAAAGAATGHMGIWVAAGIALYIAITLVGGAWSTK
jgi:hypothetical protein